ncbi:hypothetical protein RYX36_007091 [Vicia faba]
MVQVDINQVFEALTMSLVEKGLGLNLIPKIQEFTSTNEDISIVYIYQELKKCVDVLLYEECPQFMYHTYLKNLRRLDTYPNLISCEEENEFKELLRVEKTRRRDKERKEILQNPMGICMSCLNYMGLCLPSLSDMECELRIDTSEGWEISVITILESFEELSYIINPSIGIIYLKGKADPLEILSTLNKSGKHATIGWINQGFSRNGDNQIQDQRKSGYNIDYLISQDLHFQSNPNWYYQPNPNWCNNMSQNMISYGNHNVVENKSLSDQSHDSHCHYSDT